MRGEPRQTVASGWLEPNPCAAPRLWAAASRWAGLWAAARLWAAAGGLWLLACDPLAPAGKVSPWASSEQTAAVGSPGEGASERLTAGAEGQVDRAAPQPSTALVVGQRIQLRATSALGVPLHERPHTTEVSGRLPHGSVARVRGLDAARHWIEIEYGPDARRAFVIRKYVLRGVPETSVPPAEPPPQPHPGPAISEGPAACKRRVLAVRSAPSADFRVGSFNVRWFPDGRPGIAPPGPGTDVPWVACQIAELAAPVVALQEFKLTERALQATRLLEQELDHLTGGRWHAVFDPCPGASNLHLGLLYDERLVRLQKSWVEASLNPLGQACAGSLRPGFFGRFLLSEGQAVQVGSVHLKSGSDQRSFELRRRSVAALAALGRPSDAEWVVAGDLNTMGCATCVPPVSARDERLALAGALSNAGLSLADSPLGCSHFHHGRPQLLDGFVLVPATAARPTVAGGACRQSACLPLEARSPVFERVSDHCPLAVQLLGLRAQPLPSSLPRP